MVKIRIREDERVSEPIGDYYFAAVPRVGESVYLEVNGLCSDFLVESVLYFGCGEPDAAGPHVELVVS